MCAQCKALGSKKLGLNLDLAVCLRVITDEIKQGDQKQVGEKGFILLMSPHHCSLFTRHQDRHLGSAGADEPWRAAAYWLVCGLLSLPS